MMNGTTPAEELRKLAERNNMKWEAMGREAGITYQALMRICLKHGYDKPKHSVFEFRGKTAAMLEHCRDHGIPPNTAYGMFYRNQDKSRAWSLEKCLALREWRATK